MLSRFISLTATMSPVLVTRARWTCVWAGTAGNPCREPARTVAADTVGAPTTVGPYRGTDASPAVIQYLILRSIRWVVPACRSKGLSLSQRRCVHNNHQHHRHLLCQTARQPQHPPPNGRCSTPRSSRLLDILQGHKVLGALLAHERTQRGGHPAFLLELLPAQGACTRPLRWYAGAAAG